MEIQRDETYIPPRLDLTFGSQILHLRDNSAFMNAELADYRRCY